MRAIYFQYKNDDSMKSIRVIGESAKHLNVVRVKVDEEILVLNGQGGKAYTRVESVAKSEILLTVTRFEVSEKAHQISLAIANPKKEAFEDILKMSVELGVVNIYPLKSKFSQYDYAPSERLDRIIESALIQSNNPFFPLVHPQSDLNVFLKNVDNPIYFFNSQANECGKVGKICGEKIILIGPEGGFSPEEERLILAYPKVFSILMPTPILRSPTAVATSVGYLIAL